MKRGDVDLEYLKAVVIGGFEAGELPASSAMLPVLARLLHFSPEELERIRSGKQAQHGGKQAQHAQHGGGSAGGSSSGSAAAAPSIWSKLPGFS